MSAQDASIEARVDRQKSAITLLRRQVEALAEQVTLLTSKVDGYQTGTVHRDAPRKPTSGPTTEWAMKPICLTCGSAKEPGREHLLSCADCGKKYQAQTRTDFQGTRVFLTRCGYCGDAKPPSLNPQCKDCQRGYRQWKAAQ